MGKILSWILSAFLWLLFIGSILLVIRAAIDTMKGGNDIDETGGNINSILGGGFLCGGILAGKLIGGFWFIVLGIILGGTIGFVIYAIANKIGDPKRSVIEAKRKQKEEEAISKVRQEEVEDMIKQQNDNSTERKTYKDDIKSSPETIMEILLKDKK
ncbi:MAG: hypothetical protein LBL13_05675 [Bacteroidales bacterium]|jgi:hypothetical protein|nr:hypothetical protein [Bacteroidales bacterium]